MIAHLFVYGTLRSDVQHPAHELLNRYFTLLGKATVQGKLYDCGEYPGAVPTTAHHVITGELYALRNTAHVEEAINALDEYEGCLPAAPHQSLFRREPAAVQYNNQVIQAWVYWYNRDTTGMPWIRSGDYKDRKQ